VQALIQSMGQATAFTTCRSAAACMDLFCILLASVTNINIIALKITPKAMAQRSRAMIRWSTA
jgi:hypothetical protein